MPFQFKDGKPLIVDGKLALDPSCCCGDCVICNIDFSDVPLGSDPEALVEYIGCDTVFASGTVTISDVPSKACKGATLHFPVAPVSAYLDPMAYL